MGGEHFMKKKLHPAELTLARHFPKVGFLYPKSARNSV